MLSREELSNIIINTPIEHILQTRYDICEFSDPAFNPVKHFKSTVFNCTSTTCHSEAFTTFILHIIKYYCSDTFCYMVYTTIYNRLNSISIEPNSNIDILSIILMFRIIADFSTHFIRSDYSVQFDINSSYRRYNPFTLDDSENTILYELYTTFFRTISIKAQNKLTLPIFNEIISKFKLPGVAEGPPQYTHPVILKATLNADRTNLHSFAITILNDSQVIISGANGAARGLCSVTQDNIIPVTKFQEYLHTIELIHESKNNRSSTNTLTKRYINLYNDIFLKNYIIRDVDTETGLTMGQYCLILIGIFNYITDTYKYRSTLDNIRYLEYLDSLTKLTADFELYIEPTSDAIVSLDYNSMLFDVIQELPKTIKVIERRVSNMSDKNNIKSDSDSDSGSESDDDIKIHKINPDSIEDANNIFHELLDKYSNPPIFTNTQMYSEIISVITNILDQEGIPEYFLIDIMAIKHKGSVEKHEKFKKEQMNLLTYHTNIYINVLGITIPPRRGQILNLWSKYEEHPTPIFQMYLNLGNMFIQKPDNSIDSLMSSHLVLIDILNIYCTPVEKEGYYEPVMDYINNFVDTNVNTITYTQLNVYHPLQRMLNPSHPSPTHHNPESQLLILNNIPDNKSKPHKKTKNKSIPQRVLLLDKITNNNNISSRTRSKSKHISSRTRSKNKTQSKVKYTIRKIKINKK